MMHCATLNKLMTISAADSPQRAHAADIVRQLSEQKQPLIITQNGEAKIVVQDIKSYEENEETLAMLKILALGNSQIEQDNIIPAKSALEHIRLRRKRQS